MSTATRTESGFISTCNCIAGVPWDCDTCYTDKRDREYMLRISHQILKGIRTENRIQRECARNAHEVGVCRCSGALRLKGPAMYREALQLARDIVNESREARGYLPFTARAA
ncbi:hypothetical protein [Demequina lutea]|uniref:Uncharacterized protein n=1 Tax=Demequina lutea TaxID=431489 RepID=A0A7Y9ZCJ8_9MICO|nr:hypothetical protein [Demequina lutea]NYI42852.1 hypothetical protein [Demequina lutea]